MAALPVAVCPMLAVAVAVLLAVVQPVVARAHQILRAAVHPVRALRTKASSRDPAVAVVPPADPQVAPAVRWVAVPRAVRVQTPAECKAVALQVEPGRMPAARRAAVHLVELVPMAAALQVAVECKAAAQQVARPAQWVVAQRGAEAPAVTRPQGAVPLAAVAERTVRKAALVRRVAAVAVR